VIIENPAVGLTYQGRPGVSRGCRLISSDLDGQMSGGALEACGPFHIDVDEGSGDHVEDVG
jgi:hypothetical protein